VAKVVAIHIATQRHVHTNPVERGECIENFGFKGDIHAGNGLRQVSLLAQETIEKMPELGLEGFCTGKFTANIKTSGIKLHILSVGTRLKVGEAEIEISQTGKECFKECVIFNLNGTCSLARECAFAKVVKGGIVNNGDKIEALGLEK